VHDAHQNPVVVDRLDDAVLTPDAPTSSP